MTDKTDKWHYDRIMKWFLGSRFTNDVLLEPPVPSLNILAARLEAAQERIAELENKIKTFEKWDMEDGRTVPSLSEQITNLKNLLQEDD